MKKKIPLSSDAVEAIQLFEQESGLLGVRHAFTEKRGSQYLYFDIWNPSERHFEIINSHNASLQDDSPLKDHITIREVPPENWTTAPETLLLQRTLTESLAVDQHSFKSDFDKRYIRSATNAESQIIGGANNVVFGRRGSGKSSLLLYAYRNALKAKSACAWVAMQTYEHRDDERVIRDVIVEILQSLVPSAKEIVSKLDATRTLEELQALAPELRRIVSSKSKATRAFIFLDDLHVVPQSIQPKLLSAIYSFTRGNNTAIKISAIEKFARIWEPSSRTGLEPPHDISSIKLDYNLTDPGGSLEHLMSILDAHAAYCGMPIIQSLCGPSTLRRLVWIAAGVPRDGISLFAEALATTIRKKERLVSVTSVNIAGAAASNEKQRFMETDSSGETTDAQLLLEAIKKFCLKTHKTNVLMVRVRNGDRVYENTLRLVDLRFLHVLNPSITPDAAGDRWLVLLLDYGFYTGMKAGKTLLLFDKLEALKVKEMRHFPRFSLDPYAEREAGDE